MNKEKTYIAIDLKSFYASVECVERGYDPLNTNLVVADDSRTEKTICLAVSPALKSFGVPGRPRLYEVVQKVKEINLDRQKKYRHPLKESSIYMDELNCDLSKKLTYVVARPRMAFYMEYSNRIYNIYLKYIAAEDIHVYSIDEVFIDCSAYLNTYKLTARQLAMKLVKEILSETGITATVGIAPNLYLCKCAMDIVAKHLPADKDGVRIAELNEMSYKQQLWDHLPLMDFWRIGKGLSKRLNKLNLYTMGDLARCSIDNEALLYKEFGVNAELMIDHAWGYEPTQIKDIKAYKPSSKSLGVSQVLSRPYQYDEVRIILKEMVDSLVLDLVKQKLETSQIVLTINYDVLNLKESAIYEFNQIEKKKDFYGREVPKPAHGTIHLENKSSSTKLIMDASLKLFDEIINEDFLVRKINVTFCNLSLRNAELKLESHEQFSLFEDSAIQKEKGDILQKKLKKERNLQEAIITIKNKYGKNSLLKGTNLEKGATSIERNKMIGGHKA